MTANDDFQRRAGEEGRQVQEIAKKVLQGCRFRDLQPNKRLAHLGVTINFVGLDQADREWYFDVSGAFTSRRAGLIRTDTVWKSLGRASVLHQAGVERLVLLTTNLPKADSAGHHALTTAAQTFFDAVEMLTPEGKARLTLYAQADRHRPLPGLRPAAQVYNGLNSTAVGNELRITVPLLEVASALPGRAVHDLVVMPNRLKVFLPSRSSSGEALGNAVRQAGGERIRAMLSKFAGGCTLTSGVGSWLDPVGGEMLEDVTLVEAYSQGAFPGELISALVEVLVRDLRQHTAAFIVDDTMVHITPH